MNPSTVDTIKGIAEILGMIALVLAAAKWLFGGKAMTDGSIQVLRAELNGKLDAVLVKVTNLEREHERVRTSDEVDGDRLTRLEGKVETLEKRMGASPVPPRHHEPHGRHGRDGD